MNISLRKFDLQLQKSIYNLNYTFCVERRHQKKPAVYRKMFKVMQTTTRDCTDLCQTCRCS